MTYIYTHLYVKFKKKNFYLKNFFEKILKLWLEKKNLLDISKKIFTVRIEKKTKFR